MANYRRVARRAARRHGLDPDVFERQIQQESGFQTGRSSGAGAQGIAQIMPATARGWGVNPNNPRQALDAAAKHMAGYVHQFGGSYDKALRAYNAGPGAVQASHGYAETNAYVAKILAGHHPSSKGSKGGGGGGRSSSSTTTKVTTSTPGVDNRVARAQLIQNFLSEKHSDPLNFAIQAKALRDVAPTSSTKSHTTHSGGGGGGGGGGAPAGGRSYPGTSPIGGHGKVIGVPYQGTHTLGNWQSDNAVDIRTREGTPMVSLQDGVVVKVRHHPQDGGRFAGDQITIRGANGNEYFYAHGIASVKPGQRIRRGQRLGRTGSANGVPHLHFGQEHGDPRQHT